MRTLGAVSVTGSRTPLALLEKLTYTRDELVDRLPRLRETSGAAQLAVLSTCQRTELYAVWAGEPEPLSLLRALAADRGQLPQVVEAAATLYAGPDAARHLLRVAAGLESFVLGETEIAGQVRAAAEVSQAAGSGGLELDRLMAAAVNGSRRAHRHTSFAESGRSVAAAAVDAVAEWNGGALADKAVLVVGAGQVATSVVDRAGALGAAVTVCNRTRRHADRFAAAGALVADMAELVACLARADVAILGTAATQPIVDVVTVRAARANGTRPLLLVDLCMPRNVDPSVRALDEVSLLDLADLRAAGAVTSGALAKDAATAGRVIEEELARYLRWLATRSASEAVRRLRADADAVAREEVGRIAGRLPQEVRGAGDAGGDPRGAPVGARADPDLARGGGVGRRRAGRSAGRTVQPGCQYSTG